MNSKIPYMSMIFANILTISGLLSLAILFIFCLYINLSIIFHSLGYTGLIAGLVFAPVIFVAAPFYALFFKNDFLPLLICYGGSLLSFAAISAGIIIRNKLK